MAGLLGQLTGRATYRRWLYLLGGGALAFSYLVVIVPLGQLAAGAIGWPPLSVLAVVVVAVAPPLLTGSIPGVRQVEAAAVRALLGVPVADPPPGPARPWPASWRTVAWFLLHLLAGGLVGLATVVVPPTAVVLAAAPFRSATVIELGAFTWRLPRGPAAVWLVPLALALLVALVLAVAGLGALLARGAPAFLGPSPAERLAALERQAGQLAERNRLARELHDSVGHALTVATLQAGAARELLDSDPEFARDALAGDRGHQPRRRWTTSTTSSACCGTATPPPPPRSRPWPTWTGCWPRPAPPGSGAGRGGRGPGPGAGGRLPGGLPDRPGGPDQRPAPRGRVPVALRLAAAADRLELELANPLGPARRAPPAAGAACAGSASGSPSSAGG